MHKAEAEKREGGEGPSSDDPQGEDHDEDGNWTHHNVSDPLDITADDPPSPSSSPLAAAAAATPQITFDNYTSAKSPKSSDDKKRRHLDLDDFANSPAADADDAASTDSSGGEDVEMQVTMG